MGTNTPRGFQFLRAAIATLEDLGELGRVREFAREQWGDDEALWPELEEVFERREAEIEARPWTQLPLPLDEYEELDRDAG